MSFKQGILFAMLLSLGGLLGCGQYLKGNKKTEEAMSIENAETQCLKSLPGFVSKFFNDQTSSDDIEQNFKCVQAGLKTFVKYTRGENQGQYSDKEIQHFFNRYLLAESQISDAFLEEIMKVKMFVVGGNRRSFTRVELDQFTAYLDQIRSQAKQLNGQMRLIFFHQSPEKAQVSKEELNKAKGLVYKFLESFILESKISSSGFEFEDIGLILKELNSFLGSANTLGPFLRWFPLVNSVKVLFIGEHAKVQTGSEWKENIHWAVETYFLALQIFYQTKQLDLNQTGGWEKLISCLDGALELVEKSPVLLGRGLLATEHVDRVIQELWDVQVFQSSLKVELVKNTYKKVITNLIEAQSDRRSDHFEISGISQQDLAVIRLEYEIWRQTQLANLELFKTESALRLPQVRDRLKQLSLFAKSRLPENQQDILQASWEEWLQLLNKPRPPLLTTDYKIALEPDPNQTQLTLRGLSLSAALRSLTRLTLRGYGDDSHHEFLSSALSEARLIELESDFRDFGRAMGFLDKRQNGAPQRTFKEGNFFTFSGNGDSRLDGFEIFELLHFMVSGGGTLVSQMDRLIEAQKGQINDLDPMGRAKAKEQVFHQVLKDHFAEVFGNMPKLVKYQAKLSVADWESLYQLVMGLSRVENFQPGVTEFVEIRSFVSILQYVESIMIQFDSDLSDGLSFAEVQKAQPRFDKIIQEAKPNLNETLRSEAFPYLVFKGKIPDSIWEAATWSYGKKRVFGDLGEATRLDLLRVLYVLKNNGKK